MIKERLLEITIIRQFKNGMPAISLKLNTDSATIMRFNICSQCNGEEKRKTEENGNSSVVPSAGVISVVTDQPKLSEPSTDVDASVPSADSEQRLSVLERDAIAQLLQVIEEGEKSCNASLLDEVYNGDESRRTTFEPNHSFYEDPETFEKLDKDELPPATPLDEYTISLDENAKAGNMYYFHSTSGDLAAESRLRIATPEGYSLFQSKCLKWHNEYRRMHGVRPLINSEVLCQVAREWAEHMAVTNTLDHKPNCEYGQNLYRGDISYDSAKAAVTAFYEEINLYDFNSHKYSLETERFTNLVWKDTRELGTGVALRGDQVWVCCYYNPRADYDDQLNGKYVPLPLNRNVQKS